MFQNIPKDVYYVMHDFLKSVLKLTENQMPIKISFRWFAGTKKHQYHLNENNYRLQYGKCTDHLYYMHWYGKLYTIIWRILKIKPSTQK